MPIHLGTDSSNKKFYQWGKHGKKYYFSNLSSQVKALEKAIKQSRAAHANGYKVKN